MIKYYSTLTKTSYEFEKDAQKAEDKYVEEYFKEMDERAACKRRKLKNLATDSSSNYVTHIVIE